MKQLPFLLFLSVLIAGLVSCEKSDYTSATPKVTTGVYVLSEGLWNNNNTTLTYYDFKAAAPTTDYYAAANGSGLGDTGNDLIIYGSKMYIVMNVSSYVEVADALTAKTIKKIDFKTSGGAARQPRYAVAYKDKILVSSSDGTVAVIDTTTLAIDKNITVGANPEQMAIWNDKLYVANSGGFTATYDSTVSVINLNSYTETLKIKVGTNPNSIVADSAGNIYVACTGNYSTIAPKLVKVSTASNTVIKSADTVVGKIRYFNGKLYASGGYLGGPNVRVLSTVDFKQESDNFITDGTKIETPYGLDIDVNSGNVYITDAKDYITSGTVYCFNNLGKKLFSFTVQPGLNPNKTVFIAQ